MTKYKLKVVEKIITKYNEEYQDWSGKETVEPGYEETTFSAEHLTMSDILTALKQLFEYEFTNSDVFFINGVQGTFARVENEECEPDKKGKFLVDYFFTITPITEPIDLEKFFEKET